MKWQLELTKTFSMLTQFDPIIIIGLVAITLLAEMLLSNQRLSLPMKFFAAIVYVFSILVFTWLEMSRIENKNKPKPVKLAEFAGRFSYKDRTFKRIPVR